MKALFIYLTFSYYVFFHTITMGASYSDELKYVHSSQSEEKTILFRADIAWNTACKAAIHGNLVDAARYARLAASLIIAASEYIRYSDHLTYSANIAKAEEYERVADLLTYANKKLHSALKASERRSNDARKIAKATLKMDEADASFNAALLAIKGVDRLE